MEISAGYGSAFCLAVGSQICLLWSGSSICIFYFTCTLFTCWKNEELSIKTWFFPELVQYTDSCISPLIFDTVPLGNSHFMLSGGSKISYFIVTTCLHLDSFVLSGGNRVWCSSGVLWGLCSDSLDGCGLWWETWLSTCILWHLPMVWGAALCVTGSVSIASNEVIGDPSVVGLGAHYAHWEWGYLVNLLWYHHEGGTREAPPWPGIHQILHERNVSI